MNLDNMNCIENLQLVCLNLNKVLAVDGNSEGVHPRLEVSSAYCSPRVHHKQRKRLHPDPAVGHTAYANKVAALKYQRKTVIFEYRAWVYSSHERITVI
jgi:hypothetical protein